MMPTRGRRKKADEIIIACPRCSSDSNKLPHNFLEYVVSDERVSQGVVFCKKCGEIQKKEVFDRAMNG